MGGHPLPIDAETLLREQAWLHALARSLVGSSRTRARPPAVSLLSIDGFPVGRLPLPLQRVDGGWRCASMPPGARVLLDRAIPCKGPGQREVLVQPDGDTEVDWP